jgi:ferredoxin-NADP reductase
MADEKWLEGEVVKIYDETSSTRRFWIRINELEKFDFKAGQFVTFDLPIAEKKGHRLRSYSIASAPDGSNIFELVIVLVEDGLGTPNIWKTFVPGFKMPLRGPVGHFILPQEIDLDICFICTGTGIAPFRAMLNDIKNKNIVHKNLYLIFGGRKISDILYREEMLQLEKELDGFNYYFCCSREDAETYSGRTGYVHAIYEEIFFDKRPAHFYLCGWRNMLDEARLKLTEMGYDKKHIHIEIYG